MAPKLILEPSTKALQEAVSKVILGQFFLFSDFEAGLCTNGLYKSSVPQGSFVLFLWLNVHGKRQNIIGGI